MVPLAHDVVSNYISRQESRAYPFSPASVVLVNDALQLFLALFAVSLKVGLSSLFHDGSLVTWLEERRMRLL